MKNTKAYTITGIALLGGFVIFRILVQIFMFWHVYRYFEDCAKHHKALVVSFLVQIVALFVLNCYWMYLLVSGALKVIAKWGKQNKQQVLSWSLIVDL
jgi:hypothetical protein